MISLRHFAMRRGGRLLLSNVDITLHAGIVLAWLVAMVLESPVCLQRSVAN